MPVNIRSLAHGVSQISIGREATPLLVIDDLVLDPDWLIASACETPDFTADPANFYPGVRKPTPTPYSQALQKTLLPLLQSVFNASQPTALQVLMSAFALSTTPASKLRPIQMLPHIDASTSNQLAMVHYLAGAELGGTSFYRHRQTGYERITAERLPRYSAQLKAEAQAAKLHEHPAYMGGDNALFSRIHQIEAKPNRAIIYPGNLLHSGDIQPETGLSAHPKFGRLTISSFLQLS
ncbi:MAG: hypothetical protein KKA56_16045 [Gammaproteobacteria bacterium]|nr:hypothetical protein [Gammaproteobacteria bacterium]